MTKQSHLHVKSKKKQKKIFLIELVDIENGLMTARDRGYLVGKMSEESQK